MVPIQGDEITQSLQTLSTHKDETVRDAAQQALITRKAPKILLTVLQNEKTLLLHRQEIATKLLSVDKAKQIAMNFLASNGTQSNWTAVANALKNSSKK